MLFHVLFILSCLHYVLPDGNYTATTKEPHCKHASCAECKNYSNDCVCEMVMPQYCIEGKPCKLFTRCIPREQSCLLSPCFPGFRCELADITCEKAPWYGTVGQQRGAHQRNARQTRSGMTVERANPFVASQYQWVIVVFLLLPLLNDQLLQFCPAICGRAGCQCIEGFSKNDSVCVPSSSCS
ncbi:hypothetical protein NECAME_03006 [Necator americanus]|uniref:TIL domain-containing protein n=1 Tax=Necator americanus TaxID=51031 RepID=W2TAL3_NECAM|nr:hypothetical protein NECAME_03006 [Necator americanus]ETN78047.1 hypothetical protein NECAME_03006 [Necator americanus]